MLWQCLANWSISTKAKPDWAKPDFRLLGLALAVIAGPTMAENPPVYVPEPEPGYPPKMGAVSGLYGDLPVAWETYDFSIGAFDASAWAGKYGGPIMLSIMAYPPGEPDNMQQRILIEAEYDPVLKKGKAKGKVRVEIFKDRDVEGPRLTSDGQSATLEITKVEGAPNGGSGYGSIAGNVSAHLCPVEWPSQKCTDLTVSFSTKLQYDGQVPVR